MTTTCLWKISFHQQVSLGILIALRVGPMASSGWPTQNELNSIFGSLSLTQHKTQSKWIKELNTRSNILNLIEEKVGNILELICPRKDFLNRTQTSLRTIDKWDHMKLNSFCRAKDTISPVKRQPTEWEKKSSSSVNTTEDYCLAQVKNSKH